MTNEIEKNRVRSNVTRCVASLVAILLYGWINFLLHSTATLASGKIAGKQFDNSDASYLVSYFGMNFFKDFGVPLVVLLVILVVIWWRPIKSSPKSRGVASVLVLCILFTSANSFAYYDKQDFTEAYFILPNESAFFIPDVGANKDSQSQFGSEEYLKANKIPAKRFTIPHTKFSGSGMWSDFYVPTGRLIIVDRTPYNREWVASKNRGTSTKDESFPCQSSEGINITVEISIATSVQEENAAKYLYNFGVRPPTGDRKTPEVIFTSVFYGRSLAEIMDNVGRGKVQTMVCNEISSRTLDKTNAEATKIIDTVSKGAATFLESKGITLDYIGWAGTFTFDHEIQSAINRRYIAGQDVEIAKTLQPYTTTIQSLASADALRTFANKSDGKLPSNLSLWWLPSNLNDFFGGLFKPGSENNTNVPNAPKK
jgi:hypothetical protein